MSEASGPSSRLARSVGTSCEPPPPCPHHRESLILRGLTAAGLLGVLAYGASQLGSARARPGFDERCQWPAVQLSSLPTAERTLVVRRALLCNDLEHGRITAEDYSAAVTALYTRPLPLPPPPAPPPMLWAASVREVSSQYSATSWSAARALGAPDVPVIGADHANAWASLTADDQPEFLEVALPEAAHLSAVEIFETFNPGAVSQIELISESGARTPLGSGQTYTARSRRAAMECTPERIVAIRVTVDSPRVAGWNEIDAIGAQPCQAELIPAAELVPVLAPVPARPR